MGLSEEIEVATKIDIGHNNAATILVTKVTIAIAIPINFHSVSHAMTSEKSAKKTRSFFIFSFTSSSGFAQSSLVALLSKPVLDMRRFCLKN